MNSSQTTSQIEFCRTPNQICLGWEDPAKAVICVMGGSVLGEQTCLAGKVSVQIPFNHWFGGALVMVLGMYGMTSCVTM